MRNINHSQLIIPNWSAPAHIKAYSTTRLEGFSKNNYQGLNLADHVNDAPQVVDKNRQLLCNTLQISPPLAFLRQTHSTNLATLPQDTNKLNHAFDASWTTEKQTVCVVMTADCLPVLITDQKGSFVSAVHAGWRGLCDGIIEKSIKQICLQHNVKSESLLIWLGPCIGKTVFEVGCELRDEFIAENSLAIDAFTAHQDRWLADLHHLAKLRLAPFNVFEITRSEHCTYSEPDLFYSYRRDDVTGRMATLIWIE
jgi:YfiH family protein